MTDNSILLYVIFTYLYMTHKFLIKVKKGIPDNAPLDIKENKKGVYVIGVLITMFAPASFIFHLLSNLVARSNNEH